MTKTYTPHQNPLGFWEAQPKPTVEELSQHYRDKYYQHAQGTYAPDYLPEEKEYFHNVARVSLETAKNLGLETSMLDLGCGEGFFSKSFHSFGWDVACCDFSEFGIFKHNNDMLPFFLAGDVYDSIKNYQAGKKNFGLVNLQNVLEHVLDPVALLKDVKPLFAAKKSAIRVRVPNDYSDFQRALVEKGQTEETWFCPPEHLSFFDRKSLSNILEHCGYRVVSMQADFPIELFLANPHSNYWQDRSLGKGAHLTRIFCENHLINTSVDAYLKYSEAAAKLGFGRTLIAYAIPL